MNWRSARLQFGLALVGASCVSIGFFAYGALRNHSLTFNYLCWNLLLAWLPLLFAVQLARVLRSKLWSSWEAMALSFLWLTFLPNSFYMISDFIHLQEARRVNVLYDAVMFTAFIYTGVVLGFSSLLLVHLELRKRFAERTAALWVAVTLVLCSAGIYLGRDLRWNSWDILTNPGGLLFDISDRLTHPSSFPQLLLIIGTFSILLTSMYALLWFGIRAVRASEPL